MKKIIQLTLIAIVLASTGCKTLWGDNVKAQESRPAKALYAEGKDALEKGDFKIAAKDFEELNTQYSFNENAEQAQIGLIYVYYKLKENESCVAAADRYIRLYPRAKNVDYAYYMKGVANFEQDRGMLENIFPIDLSKRDPGTMVQAFNDLSVLTHRYPKSKYAADASLRLVYLRNLFANKELHVADYYLSRKMYVAAANRANYLLANYSQAPQTKGALEILVKANQAMGLEKAAHEAERVLMVNYPESAEG